MEENKVLRAQLELAQVKQESPKKKKKRDRSESSSSSDEISKLPSGRRSPATSPSPPPKRANTSKALDRPDSSTSGEIVDPPPRFSSPSPSRSRSQDLNHHSVSSPSPELSRPLKGGRGLNSPPSKKRSLSRSPVYHSRSSMSRSPSPATKPEQKPISS